MMTYTEMLQSAKNNEVSLSMFFVEYCVKVEELALMKKSNKVLSFLEPLWMIYCNNILSQRPVDLKSKLFCRAREFGLEIKKEMVIVPIFSSVGAGFTSDDQEAHFISFAG